MPRIELDQIGGGFETPCPFYANKICNCRNKNGVQQALVTTVENYTNQNITLFQTVDGVKIGEGRISDAFNRNIPTQEVKRNRCTYKPKD